MSSRDPTIDLAAEFADAAARAERRHFDQLERLGVPHDFLWSGPMRFGVDCISIDGDFYEPAGGGGEALVIPARPLVPIWDRQPGDDPDDIGDLVAWAPRAPARWWRRIGAEPILNPDAIGGAMFGRRPLHVQQHPLAWLRSGGDGIVILDDNASLSFWLAGVREVIADTLALGEEIERRLREPPVALPRVLVARSAVSRRSRVAA